MTCPACQTPSLISTCLEDHLKARQCHTCEGHWLSADDYWSWLNRQGNTLPEKAAEGPSLEVVDYPQVRFCLDCGDLMLKYRVGHGTHFYLDRCSRCGGVWLDKHEWESLRQRNLHDEIHLIFSDTWQHKNRQEQLKQVARSAYCSTLGDADFSKSQEIKNWIAPHPQAAGIMSLLSYCVDYYRSTQYRASRGAPMLPLVVEQSYRSTLGDEDFEKVMQVKDWITLHPQAEVILTFLHQTVVG